MEIPVRESLTPPAIFEDSLHRDAGHLVIIRQAGQFNVLPEESYDRITRLCARSFKVPRYCPSLTLHE